MSKAELAQSLGTLAEKLQALADMISRDGQLMPAHQAEGKKLAEDARPLWEELGKRCNSADGGGNEWELYRHVCDLVGSHKLANLGIHPAEYINLLNNSTNPKGVGVDWTFLAGPADWLESHSRAIRDNIPRHWSGKHPASDGPVPPKGFYWKGTLHEGIQPLPWKLIECLWKRPDKKCEENTLIEEVWGGVEIGDNAIKQAIKRANKFLFQINFKRQVRRKSGWVELDDDTAENDVR
jgi:hypothetical protein